MEIVDTQAMPWAERQERHREGSLAFRNLFHGVEGDPNNFRLVLSRNDGVYQSPRHRHAFDQVRFCVRGSASIAPGKVLHEGDVGYFPEGVFYGPQHDAGAARVTLVYQGGGASGLGYMSARQLRRGTEELEAVGVFAGGRFRRAGEAETRDSYEAVWEHVAGRPVAYPEARYEDALLMRPQAFAWRDAGAGLRRKPLGAFTERGVRLEMLRLDAGAAARLGEAGATTLAFVCWGQGTAGGAPYRDWTAARVDPGETLELRAEAETEVFALILPTITRS